MLTCKLLWDLVWLTIKRLQTYRIIIFNELQPELIVQQDYNVRFQNLVLIGMANRSDACIKYSILHHF